MHKILLVDDHPIVRSSVRLLIKEHLNHAEVAEAKNGDTAFQKIVKDDYDLVVLDINMPNTDSLGLVINARNIKPGLSILIFSMISEYAVAKRYFNAGVTGFLNKQAEDEEVVQAIVSVLNGKKYISKDLLEVMAEDKLYNRPDSPFEALSNREFEICYHLIKGESVTEIAGSLHIHTSTVGTYKARIFEKLKVSNLIDLNNLAKDYHLI